MEGDINGKYHDGTATFTSDQTKMYFSRNNRKGTNEYGNIDLKVYESKLKNGLWTDVVELPFNSDEYDSFHPAVTPNGNWLYLPLTARVRWNGYLRSGKKKKWGMGLSDKSRFKSKYTWPRTLPVHFPRGHSVLVF
ncbi:MAG: hypothetical protein R2788_23630 [Saprospiraceae bacterium]